MKMGNTTTKQQNTNPYQTLKDQVSQLGDQYPYGDEEIIRLSRCLAFLNYHHYVQTSTSHTSSNSTTANAEDDVPANTTIWRRSFLSDWAIFCSTLPPPNFNFQQQQQQQQQVRYVNLLHVDPSLVLGHSLQERSTNMSVFDLDEKRRRIAYYMDFVQMHILPKGFGRILEKVAFLLPQDSPSFDYTLDSLSSTQSDYSTSSSSDESKIQLDSKCCCIQPNLTTIDNPGGGTMTTILSCSYCCKTIQRKKTTTEEHKNLLEIPTKQQTIPHHHINNTNSISSIQSYNDSSNNTTNNHESCIHAMSRLQKFMEGASECSRRGSRKSLTVLFKCCSYSHHLNTINQTDVEQDSSTVDYSHARSTDLIDLAYRLSLASTFISHALSSDDDDDDDVEIDPSDFLPQPIGNTMVQSLIDFESKLNTLAGQYHHSNNYFTSYNQPFSSTSTPSITTATTNNGTCNTTQQATDLVSLETFLQWSETTCPCLSSCIETFIHYIFFPDKPYPPSRTEFMFPDLKEQKSAFFTKRNEKDLFTTNNCNSLFKESKNIMTKSSPLLFTFASMSPSLGGAWHRLYTSDSDGLSFNRLLNSLLGYSGPTLLIIKEATKGGIFGAFTSTVWKESKDFYGNSDCFLFRIYPSVAVYRPRSGVSSNFMYCNSESRSKGYDGLSHGIGFGGNTDKPRLFISESLDGCMASAADLTFESGPLLPPTTGGDDGNPSNKYFDLESLEVWGVGGDSVVGEALGARQKQREIVEANIRKARKVDKAAFLDDFKSGLIESKAFQHREQMRGREDCHIDDDHKNGYVYE